MSTRPEYTLDTLDDFVGQEIAVSEWMTIDQGLIDRFSDVSGDHQWIHKDVPEAKSGPYGAPIAHGLLLLSLTVKLAEEVEALPRGRSMCVNYGYDRIRFPAPVRAGQRIRCRAALVSYEERQPGQLMLTTQYTIEVEGGDKPAVVADCLGLFHR